MSVPGGPGSTVVASLRRAESDRGTGLVTLVGLWVISTRAIDTVLLIHVPSVWETTNRRYAFHALAEVLPPHVAVICVDRPVDLVVSPLKRPRRFLAGILRMKDSMPAERLCVVRPRLLVHEIAAARLPAVTAVNRRMLRRQLRGVLNRRFPTARRLIQWIHHPVQRWVFGVFPDAGRVYHCYDEYTCSSDGRFHPDRWESEVALLKDVDVAFATSPSLLKRRKSVRHQVALFPNGAPEFFLHDRSAPDAIVAGIPEPRIVYVGSIYDFVEFRLLRELFTRRPDWQFVLIGPTRGTAGERLLQELPNVHLAGPLAQESLPGALRRFQVGLIPFAVNAYTKPVTPLKLFEYLAAGLAVVATDLPDLQTFRHLIRLVPNTVDAFEHAIDDLLTRDGPALKNERQTAAREYTWTRIIRNHVVPVLNDAFGL
ncbi:MAG TPA: glycosyltransferase [Acidobacteriota bacterium]|nr:glycosyltransferase [Acidobacteriota bacterium]